MFSKGRLVFYFSKIFKFFLRLKLSFIFKLGFRSHFFNSSKFRAFTKLFLATELRFTSESTEST